MDIEALPDKIGKFERISKTHWIDEKRGMGYFLTEKGLVFGAFRPAGVQLKPMPVTSNEEIIELISGEIKCR